MKTSTRLQTLLRQLQCAVLNTLAALALTACGGGTGDEPAATQTVAATAAATMETASSSSDDILASGDSPQTGQWLGNDEDVDNNDTSPPSTRLLAQLSPSLAATGTVTMSKVAFSNASGQTLTGFLFRAAGGGPGSAAVVMMHGCAGVWSNGVVSTDAQPAISKLSHIHRRWGENIARAGYVGLLVDSFTSRGLTNECDNGAAGLNEAVERPKDALAARQWLLASGHVNHATRFALLGWSNGASAVMATMDKSNEGTPGARPFRMALAFYPGCGLISEFGGDASTPDKTSWLPYARVMIYHAATDPLYTAGRCANRVNKAITLGASAATGNAVGMKVYNGARHSFDQVDISKPLEAPYTKYDKAAQKAADTSVLARFRQLFGD